MPSKNLNKQWMEFILMELHEFEERIPMTPTEKREVRKWVRNGNRVCENPWYYYYDNCSEMNYLDALRCDEELINKMTEKM